MLKEYTLKICKCPLKATLSGSYITLRPGTVHTVQNLVDVPVTV